MDHPGRLVTQDELLEALWADTYVQPELLRKYILELRKVLGDQPKNPRFIETFPKRGYQFIAPVSVEGAEPAIVQLPAPAAPHERPPVGRDDALTQMDAFLAKAQQGQRQVVWVTGEAGIGKTTLMDAFERRTLHHPNVQLARGQCVEGFGGKEAYYPVLEALGALMRGAGAASLIRTLSSHAPTWLIQFPALIQDDRREALHRELLGATRERMVREICEALEALAAEHPFVLILEDLHWVDPSTLDFISALARRRGSAKLMVVATYRPVEVILRQSPLKALKQDLMIHRLCDEIPLERLSRSDVAEYFTNEFTDADLPEELATLIHRHSDGNPLFMTALVTDLTEQGVILREQGRWILAKPLDQIHPGVPETLQQMLELQVEQLSETEQRALKSASVAGRRFSAWSIAAMLDLGVAEAEDVCERLAQRQQFIRPGRGSEVIGQSLSAHYEFRHALYREALYRRLPSAQRSDLHRTLARKSEGLYSPAGLDSAASALALHFENGREYERAARYLLLSAENAARRYAHRDSIATLEHALELLAAAPSESSPQLEIGILERISDASYALGQMESSAEIDGKAAALAESRGLKAEQVKALTRMARALAFLDPDDCVTVCERAVKVCATLDDPLLRARTEMLAACWRIVNNGWTKEDSDICANARARIRELRGPALPAYDEILYAHVQFLQGEYRECCALADAGMKKATEIHSLVMYLSSLSSKSLALLHLGAWGELRTVLESGIELAERNGNQPWLGIFRAMLAWLHLKSFDLEGAPSIAQALLETHPEDPPAQIGTMALLTIGYAELMMGHPDRALPCFQKVRDRPLKPRFFLQWYWRMLSEAGLVESRPLPEEIEQASAAADIFHQGAMTTADPALRASAWSTLARVAAAKGDPARALECIERAVAEMKDLDLPSVAWRIHSGAALFNIRAGEFEKAKQHGDRADAALRLVANSYQKGDPLRASLLDAAENLKVELQHALEGPGIAGAADRTERARAK